MSTKMHRTTSDPELFNGITRTPSCGGRTRSRTAHLHLTKKDLQKRQADAVLRRTSFANSGATTSPEDTMSNGSQEVELSVQAFEKLRSELERAQQDLRSRDVQCEALAKNRDEVDQEIEELTASLFEEAHKMVYEANVAKASAEKRLYETQLKLDGLQAEVAALKLLVLTSTPSNPKGGKDKKKGKVSHVRASSSGQICVECETYHCIKEPHTMQEEELNKKEVDRVAYQAFLAWLENGCPLKDHTFLNLVHKDDIVPCLRFPNEDLAKSIYAAIQNNMLTVEALQSKQRKCALSQSVATCSHRIKTSDSAGAEWHFISNMCRARVVAVVDFLTFLRYIRQGIVKKDIQVLYWEMVKKRAQMSLSRLGIHTEALT